MIIILSPAKSLDFHTPSQTQRYTQPTLMKESAALMATLQSLGAEQLAHLMGISDKLAQLNHERNTQWAHQMEHKQGKQALLAFSGRVYEGIKAASLSEKELEYAQEHVRILSGLYGILRPLDLIAPYRLEMGTRLTNSRGRDLYAFWGTQLSQILQSELQKHAHPTLINLASLEYFKAIPPAYLNAQIITPVFQERKGTGYKIIGVSAKYARGLMTRFAIQHALEDPEALKRFNAEGYTFTPEASTASIWIFRREAPSKAQ